MVHDGKVIVDISREFLDSAGAARYQKAYIINPEKPNYMKHI